MREILFRGIDKQTGNWVYGNLVTTIYKGGWVTGIQEEIEDENISVYNSLPVHVIYDSKTIGQYTGLKDKNNKKIFEGDFLKHNRTGSVKIVYHRNGAFIMSNENSNIHLLYDLTIEDDILENWEVIGNVYENAELIHNI